MENRLQNLLAGILLIITGTIEALIAGGPCPLCLGLVGSGTAVTYSALKSGKHPGKCGKA